MTMIDPIVAEVRAARDRHAAQFDYDLNAIFQDIKRRQEASGRRYVRHSARRVQPAGTAAPSGMALANQTHPTDG
jgi:hypothetical protein